LAFGGCAYTFPFGEGGFFSRRRREKKTDEVGRYFLSIETLVYCPSPDKLQFDFLSLYTQFGKDARNFLSTTHSDKIFPGFMIGF